MFHKVFIGLKAFLIIWIGIFTLQIVKVPVLSLVQGPYAAPAPKMLPQRFASDFVVKNPFLPSSAVKTAFTGRGFSNSWVLKGTLVLGNQAKVILENSQTGEQEMFSEGESVAGTRVMRIERNSVVLQNQKQEWVLNLEETVLNKRESEAILLVTKKKQIEPIAKKMTISRKALNRLVRKVPDLIQSLELILFQGTHSGPKGFLIAVGPQLMMMDPLGFQDGDVIKTVNGVSLDSPQTLLDIFQRLESQSEIEVEIDRNQKDMVITFHVQS